MGCVKLLNGIDLACGEIFRKYYQAIVLVNRCDVDTVTISNDTVTTRISFNLKEGKSGVLFKANENSSNLTASFSKQDKKGTPYYTHRVQVPVAGVSEEVKALLKTMDLSDCFAAIRFKSGEIEIYGFNYGLKTTDYTYEAQGTLGGAAINLESRYEEYDPPYIYRGGAGTRPTEEVLDQITLQDFCDLFANIDPVLAGDFNDDFSNDFYIE